MAEGLYSKHQNQNCCSGVCQYGTGYDDSLCSMSCNGSGIQYLSSGRRFGIEPGENGTRQCVMGVWEQDSCLAVDDDVMLDSAVHIPRDMHDEGIPFSLSLIQLTPSLSPSHCPSPLSLSLSLAPSLPLSLSLSLPLSPSLSTDPDVLCFVQWTDQLTQQFSNSTVSLDSTVVQYVGTNTRLLRFAPRETTPTTPTTPTSHPLFQRLIGRR